MIKNLDMSYKMKLLMKGNMSAVGNPQMNTCTRYFVSFISQEVLEDSSKQILCMKSMSQLLQVGTHYL